MARQPKRICLVVATPLTIQVFLRDLVERLACDYDITLIADFHSNPGIMLDLPDSVELVDIAIERRIRLAADLSALLSLLRLFHHHRFDLVHSITPKAGLLGMIAGFVARVPIRIHTFTGQVWATHTGISRAILKMADAITAHLATRVYADSPSQADFIASEGVLPRSRIAVVADGSISGVDVERFRPRLSARPTVRTDLRIPPDATIIVYLGRITEDKGIHDLLVAFDRLDRPGDAYLLLVGPDESGLVGQILPLLHRSNHIRLVGHTAEPELYLAASDILALPSYREGFGTAIIEAAACGIPAVATRIYGLTDAVIDGRTGLLVEPGDREALANALQLLVGDVVQRRSYARAARIRALQLYSSDRVVGAIVDDYRSLLDRFPQRSFE